MELGRGPRPCRWPQHPESECRGNGSQAGREFRLQASQTLAVRADGLTLGSQEVLAEESIVRSGERDLAVSVLAPDTVLTGQRYDLDVLMDEPLKDATLAGGLTELTEADLCRKRALRLNWAPSMPAASSKQSRPLMRPVAKPGPPCCCTPKARSASAARCGW